MSTQTVPDNPVQSLPRVLGFWMAVCVVIGTVIGSGIFKKPQAVSEGVPEFGLVMSVWVLGGLLALMGGMVLAEVAVLYPRAGGNYVFLKESYGRWAGFLFGWVEFWIIRSASIAALATIFSESLHDVIRAAQGTTAEIIPFWPRQLVTCGVIGGLALVNARGTRLGGGLQVFLTVVKALSLLAILALPFVVWALVQNPSALPEFSRLPPVWPSDWGAVNWSKFGGALVGVLWAYHGWMNIAPVAEEIKNPSRNLPLALIIGVLALIALYLGANVAYYLVLPREEIAVAKETTVFNVFSVRLLGAIGGMVASAAVMTSVFGALNGNLLVGPRLLFAMSRDRLAPRPLSQVHAIFQTPTPAILVLTTWSIIVVVVAAALTKFRLPVPNLFGYDLDLNVPEGKALFDVVTDFAMFGAVTFETLAVASIFIVRWRYPVKQVALPYRCRLYPLLPLLYVSIMALVLFNMFTTQRTEALVGLGFIAAGAAVYAVVRGRMAGEGVTVGDGQT
jgi:amino acid transporter